MGKTSRCEPLLLEILSRKAQGHRLNQIARDLGVRYGMLVPFCTRRGIRFPKNLPLKVDESRLRVLLAEGQTHEQIATALGVHHSAIERRAARLGLQTARTGPRSGKGHRAWIDGRRIGKYGYVLVYAPLHPKANATTATVPEHRLVHEVVLGRYLTREEVVHHRDDHPWHNWPRNLRLFATNADHLHHELTARVKATPRSSIDGAYGNSRKIGRCPGIDETLAQCSLEIRRRLIWYIESHHPTTVHQSLPRRSFLRSGAWRDPFQAGSTE